MVSLHGASVIKFHNEYGFLTFLFSNPHILVLPNSPSLLSFQEPMVPCVAGQMATAGRRVFLLKQSTLYGLSQHYFLTPNKEVTKSERWTQAINWISPKEVIIADPIPLYNWLAWAASMISFSLSPRKAIVLPQNVFDLLIPKRAHWTNWTSLFHTELPHCIKLVSFLPGNSH